MSNVSSSRVLAEEERDFETVASLPSREDRQGPGGPSPLHSVARLSDSNA